MDDVAGILYSATSNMESWNIFLLMMAPPPPPPQSRSYRRDSCSCHQGH
jgi:hypothetical protein